MGDYAHNGLANANRHAKALALARFLYASPGPLPSPGRERRQVERLAGVRTSSDETWLEAIDLLAQRREWDRRHPA